MRPLTPREQEIFVLIGRGLSNKQIAAELGISVETIRNHRKNICRKLSLHSTAELVAHAARGES